LTRSIIGRQAPLTAAPARIDKPKSEDYDYR
jgi:hypothetical protein